MTYITGGLLFANFVRADHWAEREARYNVYDNEPVVVMERKDDGTLEPVVIWSRNAVR